LVVLCHFSNLLGQVALTIKPLNKRNELKININNQLTYWDNNLGCQYNALEVNLVIAAGETTRKNLLLKMRE